MKEGKKKERKKEKIFQTTILYPVKISFKNEGKIKHFNA
jgi:hypothetical protein